MTDSTRFPLLSRIDAPSDLRDLNAQQLPQLARELRDFLIASVARSTGHFASGLGTVELTVALHYLYNTPDDRIVWDVGHQSYPHKILTGRRDRIESVRHAGGLAPFPRREESEYDSFGVGHAGTSISAALGMAIAAKAQGSQRRVVAVIGDGALTSGMAFEALNHAGDLRSNLLVILNDNEMSISPNVGALTKHFAQTISGRFYNSVREHGKEFLQHVPPMFEFARRAEEHAKSLVVPGALFEEFGFNYIGPIDGHDLDALVPTLRNIQHLQGPQLVHVVTRKGKGYLAAEKDPVKYHGISAPFDPQLGILASAGNTGPTYSQVFGDWLCDMAQLDTRLVGITPAMREGSKLERFSEMFPQRYFDVGIAEQHSVAVAAGMACDGLKPVVAIYSTFLQRAYDQVIHDVVLQKLPVLFAIDRAGVVGGDGPTHAGAYDVNFLRCLPGIVLMAPSDENETRQMLYTGFRLNQPCAVRYPRGIGPGVTVESEMQDIPIGKAQIRRRGKRVALLAFGPLLEPCLAAAQNLDATVVNMRFIKPLDDDVVRQMAFEHELLVSVDESAIDGGAGSAVNESLAQQGISCAVLNLGLPDRFIEHATRAQMLHDAGLDRDNIVRAVLARLGTPSTTSSATVHRLSST